MGVCFACLEDLLRDISGAGFLFALLLRRSFGQLSRLLSMLVHLVRIVFGLRVILLLLCTFFVLAL